MFGFRPSYLKEGHGVSKEQAQDAGAKRFFRIYFREFWPLMALNLFFALCCVPVFTVFPAWKALCAVNAKLVAGENVFYVDEVKKAFLDHLPRTFLSGLVLALGGVVCLIAVFFYVTMVGGMAGVLLAALVCSVGLLLALTAWCFYPLLLREPESSFGALVKKAFAYGIAGLRYHFPALLLVGVLLAAAVLLLPWSFVVLCVWFFSFASYLNAYCMRATNAYLAKKIADAQ